jgi:formylmethanofuran dehydrogenase subunit B
MPKGMYVTGGRKDRNIITVDVRETRTARLANKFVKVEPNKDFELLQALRSAVREETIEASKVAGIPVTEIIDLAETMKSAKMGIVFFWTRINSERWSAYEY